MDDAPPTLIVTDDPVGAAAERLAAAIREADAARGAARFAISGGSALKAVAPARAAAGGAWSRVQLTWVDERCVPVDSPDSNRGAAHRSEALDPAQPVGATWPLWLDDDTPEAAVARVTAWWQADLGGGLDVTLLGMGGDGHIASLFPGAPRHPGVATFISNSPKPPPRRMTLTRAALATAGTHVLLAWGDAKRPALARLLAGDPALPAVGLSGLIIVTDRHPRETST